jgi:hypothetical protein
MMKKIAITLMAALLLGVSFGASAEPLSAVFYCKLHDGKTKEDVMAVNARWLKWARETAGTDAITSSYVQTVVGDFEGFMWVDTYPSAAAWAKIADAEQQPFDEEFDALSTCSGNRLLRATPTEAAK